MFPRQLALALTLAATFHSITGFSQTNPSSPASVATPAPTAPAPTSIVAPKVPMPPAFRLGDAAAPTSYAVRLAIDPNKDAFDGEIRIDINIAKPVETLWLNGTGLTVQKATASTAGNTTDLIATIAGEDYVGLTKAGGWATGPSSVTIQYRGKLDALSTQGLFKQQEGGDWYVVSQFEAIGARRAFPCFDEPGWKVPWQVTLDVPANLVAVSNTPQTAEQKIDGGMKRLTFATTKALPSYLLAMAIGPFDVVDGGTAGKNNTPLRYLAPKGRGSETRYAKEVTPKLIQILEDYFGIPYPFEKLDSVTIPQTVNFGAMENPGMITYASRLLLGKPFEETPMFKRAYAGVGAHEIAHQWFGNLVTMKWWDDVWLNEAFATWMSTKTINKFEPSWNDGYGRAMSRRQAISTDRLATSRRVKNPVEAKGEIWGAFDSITYQKGGQVLEMFEQALGEEKFRDGVRGYLAKHSRKNASSQDFMEALAEAAGPGSKLAANFRSFIEQPGVPLIDVALECKGAPVLKIIQQRLRPVGSTLAAATSAWTTPVCFQISEKGKLRSVCGDVSNGDTTLPITGSKSCPDWVLGNAQGRGYYVSRYDAALTMRATKNAGKLPVAEAVTMVGDATLLTESGLMTVANTLVIAERFAANPSPVVRQAVAESLCSLRPAWLSAAEKKKMQQILKAHIVPQAKKLGWMEKAAENDRIKSYRNVLLPLAADQGNDVALRKEAAAITEKWLVRRDAVPAGIVDSTLKIAVAFADAKLFDKIENEALNAKDRADRTKLLRAIGLVRDPALRDHVLALSLDNRVSGRDVLAVIDPALEDDHNRAAAFGFVKTNFDAIVARLPAETPPNLIGAFGRACTAAERNAYRDFFAARSAKYLGGARRFNQTMERIELCVAAREQPSLARGLAKVSTGR